MPPELAQGWMAELEREERRGPCGVTSVRPCGDLKASCTLESHCLEVEMIFPSGPSWVQGTGKGTYQCQLLEWQVKRIRESGHWGRDSSHGEREYCQRMAWQVPGDSNSSGRDTEMLGTIDIWHSDVPSPTGRWDRRGSRGWVEWGALEGVHLLPGEGRRGPRSLVFGLWPLSPYTLQDSPRLPSDSALT